MKAKFYLKDYEEEYGQKGLTRKVVNALFFSLQLPARSGSDVLATDFDNKASAEHVRTYHDAYTQFKKANPSYVLQWPELDVEIVPEPIPELEAVSAHVEEKLEKAKQDESEPAKE